MLKSKRQLTPISGSVPQRYSKAVANGPSRDDENITVHVVLRSRKLPRDHRLRRRVRDNDRLHPHRRVHLSREEINELYGAHEDHEAAVVAFAESHGLDVVEVSRARHDVVLTGSVGDMNRAFAVELEEFAHPRGRYRSHSGPVHVPESLRGIVEGVSGLHEVPLRARPFLTLGGPRHSTTPRELARHYRFPMTGRARGTRVAILCFDGGFHRRDLARYFSDVLRVNAPEICIRRHGGARNAPLRPSTLASFVADTNDSRVSVREIVEKYGDELPSAMATMETTMDVQLVGAIANAAELEVHFSPNTAHGYYLAINEALGLSGRRRKNDPPVAISISWGLREPDWSVSEMRMLDRCLEKARAMHVTVCCSSGDFGNVGVPPDEKPPKLASVGFPASSPYALACGGTAIRTSKRGVREVVWNSTSWHEVPMATGGGISGVFDRPHYQDELQLTAPGATWKSRASRSKHRFVGRALPDVAANADFASGCRILVGGERAIASGTSAAAPLWAALVALLSSELGHRVGWLNPLLYRPKVSRSFRTIDSGDNDLSGGELASFHAQRGWDACTGWGVPDGTRLLEALRDRE